MQRQVLCGEPRKPQGHSRVAFLPYVPYTRRVLIFKGTRIKPAGVPATVGEHVLRKRLEDRLDRKQLGVRLGVDEYTLMNWELGRTKIIPARSMPAIAAYLGYNPEPKPEGVGAQLRWKRRSLGWTARQAAKWNLVDPSTWEAWEKVDGWPAYLRCRELLGAFLALPAKELVVRQVRPASPRRGSVRTGAA